MIAAITTQWNKMKLHLHKNYCAYSDLGETDFHYTLTQTQLNLSLRSSFFFF